MAPTPTKTASTLTQYPRPTKALHTLRDMALAITIAIAAASSATIPIVYAAPPAGKLTEFILNSELAQNLRAELTSTLEKSLSQALTPAIEATVVKQLSHSLEAHFIEEFGVTFEESLVAGLSTEQLNSIHQRLKFELGVETEGLGSMPQLFKVRKARKPEAVLDLQTKTNGELAEMINTRALDRVLLDISPEHFFSSESEQNYFRMALKFRGLFQSSELQSKVLPTFIRAQINTKGALPESQVTEYLNQIIRGDTEELSQFLDQVILRISQTLLQPQTYRTLIELDKAATTLGLSTDQFISLSKIWREGSQNYTQEIKRALYYQWVTTQNKIASEVLSVSSAQLSQLELKSVKPHFLFERSTLERVEADQKLWQAVVDHSAPAFAPPLLEALDSKLLGSVLREDIAWVTSLASGHQPSVSQKDLRAVIANFTFLAPEPMSQAIDRIILRIASALDLNERKSLTEQVMQIRQVAQTLAIDQNQLLKASKTFTNAVNKSYETLRQALLYRIANSQQEIAEAALEFNARRSRLLFKSSTLHSPIIISDTYTSDSISSIHQKFVTFSKSTRKLFIRQHFETLLKSGETYKNNLLEFINEYRERDPNYYNHVLRPVVPFEEIMPLVKVYRPYWTYEAQPADERKAVFDRVINNDLSFNRKIDPIEQKLREYFMNPEANPNQLIEGAQP